MCHCLLSLTPKNIQILICQSHCDIGVRAVQNLFHHFQILMCSVATAQAHVAAALYISPFYISPHLSLLPQVRVCSRTLLLSTEKNKKKKRSPLWTDFVRGARWGFVPGTARWRLPWTSRTCTSMAARWRSRRFAESSATPSTRGGSSARRAPCDKFVEPTVVGMSFM